MEDLHINAYAFLGVLEFSLLLFVAALVFIVRSKNLARRLRLLQQKLKKAVQVPETVSFEQYLRDEMIRNQGLIERAAASQDDAEKKAVELMKMRGQFLGLEIEVRAVENNPAVFQDKLAVGLSALIEQLRPAADTVAETGVEAVELIPQQEEAAVEQHGSEPRNLIDTRDAEFNRLKEVINNQQDVMEALLKAEGELSRQDDRHELQIRLQELEALLESKDATIEELEKTAQ